MLPRSRGCRERLCCKPLLEKIEAGEIEPSFVVTHPAPLADAPAAKQDVPRQGGWRHSGRAASGRLNGTSPPRTGVLYRRGQEWRHARLERPLEIGQLACPVALYAAASTSERIAFHTLNRETGNRVRREFVDDETGKPVERDDQVKGYEVDEGEYVVLEPEEIAEAVTRERQDAAVEAFIACGEIDTRLFRQALFPGAGRRGGAERLRA